MQCLLFTLFFQDMNFSQSVFRPVEKCQEKIVAQARKMKNGKKDGEMHGDELNR